jgi:hypothetical protein
MRRNVTIVVALVLAVVGLLGFATGAFVAIGCVVLVLSCGLLAVMLGIGGPEEGDDQAGPREK